MKGSIKVIIFYVVLIAVLIIAITSILGNANKSNYTYGEIVEMFKQEKITECYVGNDNVLYLKNVDGKTITYEIRELGMFYTDLNDLILEQSEKGIITKYDYEPVQKTPWWLSFLPYIIVMVIFIVLWFFVMNQATR